MNWTGGQLHRSARQGTLSKHQRQNFAKSRLVVDKASRHFSPFPGFPGPSNARDEKSAACKEGQDVATAGNSQSVDNCQLSNLLHWPHAWVFRVFSVLTIGP